MRHGEPDPSLVSRREPLSKRAPRRPSVRRPVDAAARASAVEPPGAAKTLIGRDEQDLRVVGTHGEIDRSRERVDEQHVVPGLAAVGAAIDAPLGAGRPERAERRHVHDVGVVRVDHDPPDVMRTLEPEVDPRVTPIVRPVDTVAPRRRLTVVLLSGARIDDPMIRRGDRDVAERAHRLVVEDRLPRRPVIRAAPESAGGRTEINGRGIRWERLDVVDAPAGHRGAHRPEAERLEERRHSGVLTREG
jgi:hypothetical protein